MKQSFAPLLPPGRHILTFLELESLCVAPFPLSKRRAVLFGELAKLRGVLESFGTTCELWLDGSYFTEKEEPHDIDLTVAFDRDYAETCDKTERLFLLSVMNGGKKFSPFLDTYSLPTRPIGHPEYDRKYKGLMHYWGRQWGSGYDDGLKGYAVIKLGETDVGLRLTSL